MRSCLKRDSSVGKGSGDDRILEADAQHQGRIERELIYA